MTLLLDPEQRAAAEAPASGITLVQARAGSGKTRTIRARVPYLLRLRDSQHLPNSRILVMAYNRRIAGEITELFDQELIPSDRRRVEVRTFHGMATSMLYKFKRHTPIQAGRFDIPKTHELIQALTDWAQRLDPHFTGAQVSACLGLAAWASGRGLSLEEAFGAQGALAQAAGMPFTEVERWVERFWQQRLAAGQLTHDDTLPLANAMPAACFQQLGFMDVLADELQDLNFQQRQLVMNFMRFAESFTGLGDPAQSINGFMGADPRVFEQLKEIFANRECREYYLTTSYRCADPIVQLANRVLQHDLKQGVLMKGIGQAGPGVTVTTQGAAGLVEFLQQRQLSGERWKDMAVLFRTRKQAFELETTLAASGIPYALANASFFEQREIQDLLAYVQCLYHPRPSYAAWRRVITHCEGLGAYTAENAWEVCQGQPFAQPFTPPSVRGHAKRSEAWTRLQGVIAQCQQQRGHTASLLQTLKQVLMPRWVAFVQGDSERVAESVETVNAFITWVTALGTAQQKADCGWAVLEAIEAYEQGNRHNDPDADAVRVLTAHASKGLEFQTVALWNVGLGTFPLNTRTPEEAEAENRLLYVAVTRAKRALGLICLSESAGEATSLVKHVRQAEEAVTRLMFDLDAFSEDRMLDFHDRLAS
jgi:DNA helicase-2/ATP-dependent DNA helicase PcrA